MASYKVKNYLAKFIIIITMITNLSGMPIIVQAATEVNLLQTYVTEETITIFTDTTLHNDVLKCEISNRDTEIMGSGLLSDDNTIIKTTVLVDISTSIPNVIHDGIIKTLKKLIEVKSINEELKVIVFGDDLNILHDFSSDRYDLATAIEKIVFNGTQSMIYDAVYNTIPQISQTDKKPTFYRTILITDGVDETVSGVIKEELFIKLQNEHYPVDVIAVSSKETGENKGLAAIVRMSGGRYNSLNPNTDVAALVKALSISDYFYLEAKIPSTMLDGTTRQVDISDDIYKMSIDVKIPVYNAPGVDTQPYVKTESEAYGIMPDKSAETRVSTIPPLSSKRDVLTTITNIFGKYTLVIFISASVALVIIIAIIISVAVTRGIKRINSSHNKPVISIEPRVDKYSDNTEYVSNVNYSVSKYTIKMSNHQDPSETWTLPVEGDLLIGRAEHCSVRLEEKSVSREHCKIAVVGDGLVVVHLGTTNKTTLNGSNVVGSSPLRSGDIIKLGREVLRVDYIQTLGSPPQNPEQPRNSNSGRTESIF